MTRRLLCLAFALIAPITLLAQTTGTLTGRVVDDEGKPQVGATIRILGTRQGGLSKAPDGRFTIAGIRAGDYKVEIKVIGQPAVERSVRISIGTTTDLGTIKMGTGSVTARTTVVTGKRELVERERTGSIRTFGKDDIDRSARTDIVGMVAQQGSVSTSGVNGFSIRGGRATETSIRVDGVDVGDPFVGSFGNTSASLYPTVSVLAVQEVQVIPSGFSAEFGDVLSGMVNSVTRSGSTEGYEGIFRYRTQVPALYGYSDDILVTKAGTDVDTVLKGVQRLGSGSQLYEFGFGGPIPFLTNADGNPILTFYLTGKYNTIPYTSASYDVLDMSPEFAAQRATIAEELWGYSLQPINIGQMDGQASNIHDVNAKLKLFLSDEIFMEFGGEIGLTTREFGSWSDRYRLDHPAILTLRANGTVDDTASYAIDPVTGRLDYTKPLKVNTELVERDMQAIDQNTLINRFFARWFQNLDEATYIDITGSYVRNRYEVGKKIEREYSIFEPYEIQAPIDNDGDKMIDVYEAPTGLTVHNRYLDSIRQTSSIQMRNPYTGLYEGDESSGASRNPYGIIDLNFPTHGNDRNLDMRQSVVMTLKGTYETNFQLDDVRTQVKAGFDFSSYQLSRHYNSLPWYPQPFFDVYGETAPYYDTTKANDIALRDFLADPFTPFDGAVWVQTRFDYKSILFQPGVRFDFISPNSKVAPALRRDNAQVVQSINNSEDASLKFQVSPRIGVSYPVTESSQFRVNFAMMFKMPEFNWMFDNAYGNSMRGNQVFGDPNIDPQKVFNYEIGYQASFENIYYLDVVAYYRDIYNQTGITYIPAVPSPYMLYSVQEYGSVRGLELEIGRAMSDNFSANVSYTLVRAVGTASSPGANYNQLIGGPDPNTGENRTAPLQEYPLDYDQTHKVNATFALSWGKGEGPSIGGIPLLENTTISVIGSFASGLPYTRYNTKGIQQGEYNAERQPSVFGTEGHLERRIPLRDLFGESVGNLEISLFADVFNILNTTGPVGLYSTTGSPVNNGTSLDRGLGDFISTPYFRDVHPGRSETYDARQYDRFGQRFYNPYADLNLDGVVTQLERYEGYQRFVSTFQNAFARNNYQTPRTVAVGVKLRF